MEHYWPRLSGPDTPGKPPRPSLPHNPVGTLIAGRDLHGFASTYRLWIIERWLTLFRY